MDLSRSLWENAVRRVILLIEQWDMGSKSYALHDDYTAIVLFSRRNKSRSGIPLIVFISNQYVKGESICTPLSLLITSLENHTLSFITHPNAMFARHKNKTHPLFTKELSWSRTHIHSNYSPLNTTARNSNIRNDGIRKGSRHTNSL